VSGAASADHDMPASYRLEHLRKAFERLVWWQEKQGLVLLPRKQELRPDPSWKTYPGGRFWWKGPLEALVIGKLVQTAEGPAARKMTSGEEHLHETGGKVAFRVGAYFAEREHVVEYLVKRGNDG
jgi:hypothetical protein